MCGGPGWLPQQEGPQLGADNVGIEAPVKSLACGTCRLQSGRLVVEQVKQYGCGPRRIVEGPEPALDAIVAELGYAPDVSGHDGKAGRHRLDDGQGL